MKMQKRSYKLDIYVHENLKDSFLKFLEINYMFSLRLGFDLEILTFKNNQFFPIDGKFGFTAKDNSHLIKLSDFIKPGDASLVSSSFLFEIEGSKLFYTGDVGSKDDLILFKDKTIDYIISEVSHIEIPDLFNAFKLQNPSLLFITHIADEIESQLMMWYKELNSEVRNRIVIPEDGIRFELKAKNKH